MHAHHLLWIAPLLSLGCPGPGKLDDQVTAGGVRVCAGLAGEPAPDTGFTWDVDGEVLGEVDGADLGSDEACYGTDQVIQVAGDDGGTYQLGLALLDEDGATIPASLGLSAGDRVNLSLLAEIGYFYTGYGLVLRRDEQLVAAVSDNKPPTVAGLDVSRGEQVASEPNECGERRGWQLVFTADDTQTLAPVASGPLTVAGVPMTATALAAWDWGGDGDQCTDLLSFWEWAVLLDL